MDNVIEPIDNTNNLQLELLIAGDSHNLMDGIKKNIKGMAENHKVRFANHFKDIRPKNDVKTIGILLMVITKEYDWFEKLIVLRKEDKFKNMKIIVCTTFTEKKILDLLRDLNISGSFGINATRTETIFIVTTVHNGNTSINLIEDNLTHKIILNKKNRNVNGTYKMDERLKVVLELLLTRIKLPAINKITGYKVKTMNNWIDALKAESNTHNRRDYLAWALKYAYIDKV